MMLTQLWVNMHKYINIFGLIILMFTNYNISAADLYDIYKRALIHNNEFAIVKNDHKVSEEKYNQMLPYVKKNFNIAKKFIDWDDNIVKSIFEKLNISY